MAIKAAVTLSSLLITNNKSIISKASRFYHFLHNFLNLFEKISFIAITLVTALTNWPPVIHLQWLGHVPHVRQHLLTIIVWNSQIQELIGSVMISSLLLPTFGTLSLPLYFRLPSKGRSIATLGTGARNHQHLS